MRSGDHVMVAKPGHRHNQETGRVIQVERHRGGASVTVRLDNAGGIPWDITVRREWLLWIGPSQKRESDPANDVRRANEKKQMACDA